MSNVILPVPVVPQPFPEKPQVGTSPGGTGVLGQSNFGVGVWGQSLGQPEVQGARPATDGVLGEGKNGVHGISSSGTDSGIWGENLGGGYGVSGVTHSTFQPGPTVVAAVWGANNGTGAGVKGTSTSGDGVLGFSGAKDHAGVSAANGGGGWGLWAGGTPAGHFEGNVEVIGDLSATGTITAVKDIVLQGGQDCAEEFDLAPDSNGEPGTVMVFDGQGDLKPSQHAYDRRVAGIVSGAGDYKPALILDRTQSSKRRVALGLVGKVFCKVDARYGAIEVGDLLTTSPTAGHAMKATDPAEAFGAVLGKALRPLPSGRGLVPVLVALQ